MRASLVGDALEMARTQGQAAPGAVFHSDHGSQYTSDEFVTYCTRNGFVQSMGRTGVCWDNAAAETFFAALKNEMYHQQVFHTRARARFAAAEYIEVFYNRRRPHSSLGYRTPRPSVDGRTRQRRRGPTRGGLTHQKLPRTLHNP